jgi:hypothetical protein
MVTWAGGVVAGCCVQPMMWRTTKFSSFGPIAPPTDTLHEKKTLPINLDNHPPSQTRFLSDRLTDDTLPASLVDRIAQHV